MPMIDILCSFTHYGISYYKGERRVVRDTDASYFCGVGWAKSAEYPTGELDLSEKTLEVQSIRNLTGVKVHG